VKFVRISHDDDGGSRSSDVIVNLEKRRFAAGVPALLVSRTSPAAAVSFVEFPADVRDTAPHPTPQRQFGVVLSGTAETETTEGEVRRLTPGSVVLVEDTEGRGHITRVVEPTFRILFVALEHEAGR
jgi:hypothetical protein